MTKAEMIIAVAEKAGMTKKDAEKAVSAVLETVTETLKKGDKVRARVFPGDDGQPASAISLDVYKF